MSCRYPDQDLPRRLDRGLVRYNGHPYIIRTDRDRREVSLISFNSKQNMKVQVDDPALDISTPPLGYFQANASTVLYVTRRPMRQFRQTVSDETVSFSTLGDKEKGNFLKYTLFCKGMEDALLNIFPSYEEVRVEFERSVDRIEKALSIDVALQWVPELKIIHVYYKNELVGLVSHIDPYTVIVPNSDKGWIVSRYLGVFRDWKIN